MWKRKISIRINYSDIKKLAFARLFFFFFSNLGGKRVKEGREGGKKGKGKGKGGEGRRECFHKF